MYVAGSPLTRIDCSRIKEDKDLGARSGRLSATASLDVDYLNILMCHRSVWTASSEATKADRPPAR
jgi:hypothetical protein